MRRGRGLFVGCLLFIVVRFVWVYFDPPDLPVFDGVPGAVCELRGRVYQKEYRTVNGKTSLIVYLSVISSPEQFRGEHPIHKCICYMDNFENKREPLMGSEVLVKGEAEGFALPSNPGEFHAARYYASLGIGARLNKCVLEAEGRTCNWLSEGLWRLKGKLREKLWENLPEEEASVMQTMLLGDKGMLDTDVKELYKRNGIIHILAISGLHISLLGMGGYRLLRKAGMPVIGAAVLGSAFILLYGCMIGMGISAMRAVGMFLLHMLGECLGRTYDMLTALGVLAVLAVILQPFYLYNSGFLLSFGSVLGIGCLGPALEAGTNGKGRYRKGAAAAVWEKGRLVRQAWLSGMAVTLMTLPVHLGYYYELPIYAILLNLVVLPLMSVLMPAGLWVMLAPAGLLALPGSVAVRGILGLYERLCRWSEALPFHTAVAGCPAVWQTAAYLAVLGIVIVGREKLPGIGRWLLIGFGVLLLILRVETGLRVDFLDVGQGDCICVRTKAGEAYLIDCGSSTKGKTGEYQLLPYLKHEGIRELKAVFVTHPDSDHDNGILQVLEEERTVRIGRLVLPDVAEGAVAEGFSELEELAQERGIPVNRMHAGIKWQEGQLKVTCLHPPKGYGEEDTNVCSQVLYMEYGAFTLLLTGDVEGEGEELLLQELQRRAIEKLTVLKVAHHGSGNSSPAGLLTQLSPRISVISCGLNNRYGHPHKELLERLEAVSSAVYRTSEGGAVTVWTDGNKVKAKIYQRQKLDYK